MKLTRLMALALVLGFTACAGPEGDDRTAPANPPPAGDPIASGSAVGEVFSSMVEVDPAIIRAWTGIRLQVSHVDSDQSETVEAMIGEPVVLGNTGLTLLADTFIPDFVMNEGVIHNRSAAPHNPAARVVISSEGAPDYKGWLFADMPGIPPYPHPQYRVLLVEGIPAE